MVFMKKNVIRIICALLAAVLVLGMIPALNVSAATENSVGALWDGFASGTGTFTVTEFSRLFVVGTSAPAGRMLETAQLIQRQLRAQFGENCFDQLVWGDKKFAKAGDIVLVLDSASGTGADGYKLDVNETTATVTAADTDGLLYGANSLMKCFRAVDGNSISGFSGYDTPDTRERTVHLDLARKYYTVEWVCNFIRQISWMGYNALELHTSEDGGFRADLWDPAYYKGEFQPENDFSWLAGSYIQSWVKDPYRNDPNEGDYLTAAELIQIFNVAKEYHIEIIPSFDSPAHMDYITWKFEQNYKSNKSYSFTYNGQTYKASSTNGCINYTGRTGDSSPTWPHYTTIDITDGTMAKAFVFAIYEDMADFFKVYAGSTKFNIGADEVNMTSSASSYPRTWNYSQFPGYVNDLNRMLNAKGYTVRMYNDFIGSTTYNQEYDTSEGISSYNSIYEFDSNIEICYWTSDFHPTTGEWSEPIWHVKFFWENNTGTTDNWGDGGRTMYNCIQTNTYYVLREGTSGSSRDARDPNNRNWTFYGTNEQDIYNNWYPADISERGDYKEDAADVPDAQLGGAYFLIWNDYAALNTEEEVWNGALDCWDKDRYYYIFDIMGSNIIKMWNSDINKTLSYTDFAKIQNAVDGTVGDREFFPGFTSCSANASLPVATAPVKASDVNTEALEAAYEARITEQGNYTDKTWNAYQTALSAAKAVLNQADATQEQVDEALANLKAAEDALISVDKTALNKAYAERITAQGNYTTDSWNAYQNAVNQAYEVIRNGEATQDEVDQALNDLNAAFNALVAVDKSMLQAAYDGRIKLQGNYTDETWAEYAAAVEAAKTVLETTGNTQAEVDAALAQLNAAKANLEEKVVEGDADIISFRKTSSYVRCGKKAGLVIYTSTDAETLTVTLDGTPVEVTSFASSIQSINGEEVKVWIIYFKADTKGEIPYLITVNGATTETVNVTVK